jgi:hypothetical protein
MDIETFKEYYLDPISLGPDDANAPLPQIFKDISVLKIQPEENVDPTRKTYTFINKNLDIITVPHDAYLYVRTKNNTNANTASEAEAINSISIPSTVGLIDGFDYMINDTTVCTQNNSLASTLYAVNNGIYAVSSKSLEHLGLSDPNKGPFNLQAAKVNTENCEWIIPLKLFVPFLKDNKILWGVKQTLKITRADVADILYKIADGTDAASSDKFEIKSIELRMPYVKLENQKQLNLWSSMYSSTVNRYWLDVDQFWSSPANNVTSQNNSTFRVATKGLNSRPRYLMLHAVDDTGTKIDRHRPMGFGRASAYDKDENTIRFKKIRLKLNGIYIDNGDVMEFSNVDANASGNDGNPFMHNLEYVRAYDEYCKFFGQYYSKRTSVKSFEEWSREQLFVFDLNNIDNETIFQNSGHALIIEIEYSTYKGATGSKTGTFKLVANVLYDKELSIQHNENKAVLTLT